MQTTQPVIDMLKKQPRTWFYKWTAFLIVFLMAYWSYSSITFNGINENSFQIIKNILRYLVWPDSNPDNLVLSKYMLSFEKYAIPYLMFETVMIAFIGTLLGAIFSIPLAFVSSKNLVGEKIAFLGSFIITLIRTVPIFIWGIIFIRIQGGAMAGIMAIAVSSIGMMSKLFIEVIEDMDKGILEALDSMGANLIQKIRFGIMPQLTASFLSTSIYRFEINVKNATILGMVGAGGIGFTLIDALGSFNFAIVAVALWGIIPVVLLIEVISSRIRKKLAIKES